MGKWRVVCWRQAAPNDSTRLPRCESETSCVNRVLIFGWELSSSGPIPTDGTIRRIKSIRQLIDFVGRLVPSLGIKRWGRTTSVSKTPSAYISEGRESQSIIEPCCDLREALMLRFTLESLRATSRYTIVTIEPDGKRSTALLLSTVTPLPLMLLLSFEPEK